MKKIPGLPEILIKVRKRVNQLMGEPVLNCMTKTKNVISPECSSMPTHGMDNIAVPKATNFTVPD